MAAPEYINAVAIRVTPPPGTALVYSMRAPARHHDVIHYMITCNRDPNRYAEQGFLTSHDRFVDRQEAAAIARRAGQVTILHAPPDLYSEDLW